MKHVIFILSLFLSTQIFATEIKNVVKDVEIKKYQGQWFEIARITNIFQKLCAKNVTAQYSEDANSDMVVVKNICETKKGRTIAVNGRARVNPKHTDINGALQVTFAGFKNRWLFESPFDQTKSIAGDYWVLGLGTSKDYGYSIVGDANSKYGWILSRQATLDKKTLKEIAVVLKKNNYRTDEFIMTAQDGSPVQPGTTLEEHLGK